MTNPKENKLKEYYQTLQAELTDRRDVRGKKHELAFVITCFVIAILKRYDLLSLAKIHRTMKRIHDEYALAVDSPSKKCISRVQLSRVLEDTDFEKFNRLTERFFGFAVSQEEQQWFAIDGKELRGSIDCALGDKRGESAVIATEHSSRESFIVGYYTATKESEKNIVNEYFKNQRTLVGKCYTLDALHNSAGLLSDIETKQGTYLVQIKSNQKHLYEDLMHIKHNLMAEKEIETVEKGHGRIDCRKALFFHINQECLDKRWSESGMNTVICVIRQSHNIKKGQDSEEVSYYVSNMSMKGNEEELFKAVRAHWYVETNNWIRDVNFGEDFFRSLKPSLLRFVSSALTAVLNGLMRINLTNNLVETREELADKSINDRDFFFQ